MPETTTKLFELENSTNHKNLNGVVAPYEYQICHKTNLVCLVVYGRRAWTKIDAPICIATLSTNLLPAAQRKIITKFKEKMLAQYAHLAPTAFVDFSFQQIITEFKNWLDDFKTKMPTSTLDRVRVLAKIQELSNKETEFEQTLELTRQTKREQLAVAKITAAAGQDLRTAWAHATKVNGVQIWTTQYYNFPD